ncbi:MAG TPA: hypothetical protein EYP85_09800 [Armatimonadetes bacterium]|nr:hypothetical protein [Armatimonadota bacterium]
MADQVAQLLALLPRMRRRDLPAVVGALGEVGDERVVQPLCRLLPRSQAADETALGRCVRAALRKVMKRLARRTDPAAVEALFAVLYARDEGVRVTARRILHQVIRRLPALADSTAVGLLRTALRLPDEYVRRAAAAALRRMGRASAVEPLCFALSDRDEYVRRTAAAALGELNDPRALEPLCRALGDGDEYVRREAVTALGKLKDPRAVKPLGRVLKTDWDWEVRERAAWVLGQWGRVQAVPDLVVALQELDEGVRAAARRALQNLLAKWEDYSDPQALRFLEPALNVRDPEVRHWVQTRVLSLLAHLATEGNDQALRSLRTLLRPWRRLDGTVRQAAVRTLACLQARLHQPSGRELALVEPSPPGEPTGRELAPAETGEVPPPPAGRELMEIPCFYRLTSRSTS